MSINRPLEDADTPQIKTKLPKSLIFFAKKMQPPSSTFSINTKSNYEKLSSLLADLNLKPKILVIGSGKSLQSVADRYLDEKYSKQTINLDIDPKFPRINVVADGHELPFKSDIFHAVIIDAVLEHVKNSNQVVDEIHRVLKEGGYVYAEIPFIQGFHADPYDYQRFTTMGIKQLFSGFIEVDSGVCVGPSSALAWILREHLAILCSFSNDLVYHGLKIIFGWLTFWIKYLDVITAKSNRAKMIASGVYFWGKKKVISNER